MKKKKINLIKISLNVVFQLSLLIIAISFFKIELSKIEYIFSKKIIFFLLFLVGLKFILSSLFYLTLKVISNSKNLNYLDTTNTFLQGGAVNQLFPGAGLAFKYFKLKTELNISFVKYSVSQSILSLSSLINYIILALIFGLFLIKIDLNLLFFLLFLAKILIILIVLQNKKIYLFFKKNFLKIEKINNIYFELKTIKLIFLKKIKKFILIYIGFILLAILECISFYLAIFMYGLNIDFITSNFLYLSSSLITVISMINFIGFFEIIITFSASLFSNFYEEIIYVSIGFKILNIISLILLIFINRSISLIKKSKFF